MNRREVLASAGATALVPAAFALTGPDEIQPVFHASFRLGPLQGGAGNHHIAEIIAGELTGNHLSGRVLSGRVEWLVDPCSGAAQIAVCCTVMRADGEMVELRDRTAHVPASDGTTLPGHPTAPVLFNSAGAALSSGPLVGRLDTTAFWRGYVSLRAFEPA